MASVSSSLFSQGVIPSRGDGEGPHIRANITQTIKCHESPNGRCLAPLRIHAFLIHSSPGFSSTDRKRQTAHKAQERTTRPVRAFAEGKADASRKENSKSKMLRVCAARIRNCVRYRHRQST